MPLNAGAMRARINIEQLAAGADGYGQPNGAWQTVASVWAEPLPASARVAGEQLAAGQEVATTARVWRIRYREDVTPAMRVTHGPTHYRIAQVLPDLRGREFVDLACVAGGVQ